MVNSEGMANPIDNLKPYVKGQSGNPGGKPKGLITKDKVAGLMGRFSAMSREELEAIVKNRTGPIIESAIAAIYLKAVSNADFSCLEFLLTRSIGKVKEEIEQTVKSISDDDLDQIPRDKIVALINNKGA